MGKVKLFSVDPQILERIAPSRSEEQDEFEEDPLRMEDIQPYLDLIPPREVDLIEMATRMKKKQKEIAAFFSISQGAVSHRLTRARKRIDFLRDMPKISDPELLFNLNKALDPVDALVVFYMVRTTCQSKSALIINKRLGLGKTDPKQALTQVKVRHKFHKSVQKLEALALEDSNLQVTADLSRYVLDKGLYMLHEVKLPHFHRGDHALMDMYGCV